MSAEEQLSQQIFQSRQAFINKNVLAYIDIKQKSPCIVVCLHEHYGLQNYLRLMVQYITNNQYSIVIPSLFTETENDTETNDDATFLTNLDHAKIAEIVYSVIDYAAKSGKVIILIGFSVGAAIGLKMLQYIKTVDLAFFFYGLPPLDKVNANLIKTQTKVFLGAKDRINYLSERALAKAAKKAYLSNEKISVIEVAGAQHGFMNPACSEYSQKNFEHFGSIIQERIHRFIKENREQGKIKENILDRSLIDASQNQSQKRLSPLKKRKGQQKQKEQKKEDEQKKEGEQDKKKQEGKEDNCTLI